MAQNDSSTAEVRVSLEGGPSQPEPQESTARTSPNDPGSEAERGFGTATKQPSDDDDDDANKPLGHLLPSWQIHLIFTSLAVAGFLASLDQTIVSTSMPTIASHFNALNSQSWIATSYLISSTCFQPVFGRFCDLWGCKLMLLVSIGLFEFGSVLTATAKNFVWLCCGRATAGIGAAGLQVVIFVLIAKMVPLRERGRYTGVMFARIALASALGPVLGGVFTTSVSWRWAFYINLPIGGVATLVVLSLWTKIPDSKLASVKVSDIDFVGVIILTASVVALSLSLTWGGVTYPWKSPQVIALLSVGFALIPLFIVYEMKVPEVPIIPMSIFKYRNVVGAATNYFFIHWGLYGLSVYLPTFFQLVKGDDQLISGFELLAYVIPILPMSFTVGILISRTGWVRPYLWSGGAVNLIGTGCCILFTSKTSKAAEFVILIVTGMGIGFVFQANTICGQSQVKRSELASAVTMVTWSRTLGGLFAIPAEGAVIQNIVNRKVEGNSVTAPYISVLQSTSLIHNAPQQVQKIIADAYGSAFSTMMIMATAFTAIGFLGSLMIERIDFSSKKTGSEHSAPKQEKRSDAET